MVMCGLMCKKINQIPSIEVSDKDHFKKSNRKCNIDLGKLSGYANCNKRKRDLVN